MSLKMKHFKILTLIVIFLLTLSTVIPYLKEKKCENSLINYGYDKIDIDTYKKTMDISMCDIKTDLEISDDQEVILRTKLNKSFENPNNKNYIGV